MKDVCQRDVQTNGIRMHIAEAGEGPLVLLCHGFPESWYSWRHQLVGLAASGYHAVAPDMRGYGRTDAPEDIGAYSMLHLVGDLVGLLDALGEQTAVIVGHDWGSMVAWNAALMRPDRFRAVVGMSVAYMPRIPVRTTELLRQLAGDRFMYMLYFQRPGVAEAELEVDPRRTLRMLLYSGSGSVPSDHVWDFERPKTAGFLDGMLDPTELPSWLSKADLDFYAAEFERTGFRGALNWYRNLDRNWELLAAWNGAKVHTPALFIGGQRDLVVTGPNGEGSLLLSAMDHAVPDLRGTVLIDGAGHWTQQEAPAAVNEALIGFLGELD